MIKLLRRFKTEEFQTNVSIAYAQSEDKQAVKLMLMKPKDLVANAPALIYYHSGGFALTYGPGHLKMAEEYAIEAGCLVVFVEYRLAPKNPYPNGFNDCYAALQWLVDNAKYLNIDTSRIAVAGDSAGGNLATSVAMKAQDTKLADLCGVMLVYPVLDRRCETISAKTFVDVPLWNTVSNERMWDMYLKNINQLSPPYYFSPFNNKLSHFPSTYIETAEFDTLRDEALLFAKELDQINVNVTLNETLGTVHAYDAIRSSEITKSSMEKRYLFLNRLIFSGSDS